VGALRSLVAVLVVILLLAVVATGIAATVTIEARPVPQRTLDCGSHIEVGKPRTRLATAQDVLVGPVSFANLMLINTPSALRSLGWNGHTYSIKVPIFVRAGLTAVVSVAPVSRRWVSLSYSATEGNFPTRLADGIDTVAFNACPRVQRASSFNGPLGVATEFSGGLILLRPACVTFNVWAAAGNTPASRTVGIGRTC
jgi:hypothetical protein